MKQKNNQRAALVVMVFGDLIELRFPVDIADLNNPAGLGLSA